MIKILSEKNIDSGNGLSCKCKVESMHLNLKFEEKCVDKKF